MPTLPMQAHSQAANGWHGVFAPGGYEWWRFCAEGEGQRVVVTFFDGWPVDPAYVRGYARYRRRPTRVVPPLPRDCRGVEAVVSRSGQAEHRLTMRLPPSGLIATDDPSRITIGESRMEIRPDGSFGLQVQTEPSLAIEMVFRPPSLDMSIQPTASAGAGQRHHWLASPCRYAVAGTISQEPFTATGTWDHAWGVLPLGTDLRRWMQDAARPLET